MVTHSYRICKRTLRQKNAQFSLIVYIFDVHMEPTICARLIELPVQTEIIAKIEIYSLPNKTMI